MSTGSEMLLERVRAATADEYHIECEIGLGGMAAVFLARDIALDRHVAIKVMRPDLLGVEGLQDRFVIEARTAAHLDHPGIVTVYAVKQRAGLLFIVMKYIHGRTLEGVLRAEQTLDAATVAAIMSRVADALHFAHGEGVVHRDVKPSNIMIDTRGRPVVTDFGIARVMAAQSITVAGSMLGTPSYMSPEQCRGLPATAASDQYSLGVTMYEMLTGRVPFGGTLFEVLDAHRTQAPMPIGQLVSGVDPALEETVMRMLAKDPQHRWGSLAEVVQRLAMTAPARRPKELRATLALMAGGPSAATPSSGIGAIDLLTPSSGASPFPSPAPGAPALVAPTPVTPEPVMPQRVTPEPVTPEPTVPVPTAPLGETWLAAAPPDATPTPSADRAADVEPRPASRRLFLIGGGAALLLALIIIAAVVLRPQRGATAATPMVRTDSIGRADTPTVQAVAQPPAAVARDSTATSAPTASPPTVVPPSAVPSTTTANAPSPPARVQSSKATLPPRSSANASQVAKPRADSVAADCARLLERLSLGEKLTEAERAVLRRNCNE